VKGRNKMAIAIEDMKTFQIGTHWVIEANAGTGKTYTIENFVAQLIVQGKAKAEEILLLTYTIKAAAELRARVRDRLSEFVEGKDLDSASISNIAAALAVPDGLWNIQTVHGFCQRSLLEYAMLSGTTPNFRIANEREIVIEVIDRALRTDWLMDPNSDIFLAIAKLRATGCSLNRASLDVANAWCNGYRSPNAGSLIASGGYVIFDGLSNSADDPEEIAKNEFVEIALRRLPNLVESYRFQNGLMTFNSMILDLYKCIQENVPASRTLVQSLRRKFRVCIVDEFQDTDALQWEIFKTIFAESDQHSFICVGDPKQSIYGFRGADLKTYQTATGWLCSSKKATRFGLTENWRTSAALLAAVNEIFSSPLYEDLGYTQHSIAARANVGIWEDIDKKRPIKPLKIMSMTDSGIGKNGQTRPSISFQIANEIHELMKNPPYICVGDESQPRTLRYSDIMILTNSRQYVTNAHASGDQVSAAMALAHFGIPCWVYRYEKLFLLPEVQTLLDVFVAALSPEDFNLRNRAFLAPLVSGKDSEIWQPSENGNQDDESPLREAERFLRKVQEYLENKKFNALLGLCRSRVLSHTDLSNTVKTNIEVAVERLCEAAILEGLGAWQTISRLREWILAGDGADNEGVDGETSALQIQGQSNTRNAVTLMTWHSSKGCEAPVVFVIGGFKQMSNSKEPQIGLNESGMKAARFGGSYKITAKALLAPDADEHRRLQYVVLTRASVLLYVPCITATYTTNPSARWHTANEVLKALLEKKADIDCVEVTHVGEFDDFPPVPGLPNKTDWSSEIRGIETLVEGEIPDVLGFVMSSYSSLKRKAEFHSPVAGNSVMNSADDSLTIDADEAGDDEELSKTEDRIEDALAAFGGKDFGIFVHTLYEDIRWDELKEGPESRTFQAELDRIVEERAFEIFNTFGADAATSIRESLLKSLTTPLCVADVVNMPRGIWEADKIVCEVNFHLPDVCTENPLPQERFFKGFIDVVFSHGGKTYFADWKTDRLEPEQMGTPHALGETMRDRGYELQLQLYSKALFRALNGTSNPGQAYSNFGGGVYLFIRYGEGGVYARRPSLEELQAPLRFETVHSPPERSAADSGIGAISATARQVNP
jgi:exodeoxyribonuclease V beta subunit